MTTLIYIIIATVLTSLLALVGIFTLFLKEARLKRLIMPLVAFSAGTLFAGALLHIIPESLAVFAGADTVFLLVIGGFSTFFLLEQFIHWHHCHRAPSEHKQPVTYLVLISDSVHNFLDGLAIGSAFMIDARLGVLTTIAVAAHEIPQELGDFGILVHGGWEKGKALMFNLLSGVTTVIGGLLAWLLAGKIDVAFILPFTAGTFIYIAASDLIPEVKHQHDKSCNTYYHFAAFLVGIGLMWVLGFME